jgi:hypothetical protein
MAASVLTRRANAETLAGQGIVTLALIMRAFIATATEVDPVVRQPDPLLSRDSRIRLIRCSPAGLDFGSDRG